MKKPVRAILWGLAASGLCVLLGTSWSAQAADPAAQSWDCIQDQAGLIGHWEVQVDGDFSEFIYSTDLYPGNQSTRVALTHVALRRGQQTLDLSSDQVDLTIHLRKPSSGVCPIYGEPCDSASVSRI